MSAPILYVDDDQANLVIFESALEGVLPILTANSGPAALEILRSREISVLLTDQRMPGMSGVDLAEIAKVEFPETIRMMITAYSDLNAAIEAINRGQIHLYLRKPWDTRELRLSLQLARERYLVGRKVVEMETRLAATERLYSLGVISAGIAHEIRNPLGAMDANLHFVRQAVGDVQSKLEGIDARLTKKLTDVDEALADCTRSIEAIIEIMRSMELGANASDEGLVDLEEVVGLAVRSLRGRVQRVARLELDLARLQPIRGSRTKLGQVVLNLVINAVEAMDPALRATNQVKILQYARDDAYRLVVEDNGPGMPKDVLARVFDPFFTTKPSGGTGLGLAISRQIVEELGGSIDATSEVGVGTRFVVSLPIPE
ncbi:sensor histidine kinase [Vulgatibacter incomptus]|uniref:histidine kinase n=1 Tax=Vulgatibacter incomptus TaxID=1391653 RepID=A0A0K1PIG1_9BACT|nr:ATP-binding protein [Vulgatibacter incomptus]AKU93292.1 Two component response regulator [Vulgatibacter incomptus]